MNGPPSRSLVLCKSPDTHGRNLLATFVERPEPCLRWSARDCQRGPVTNLPTARRAVTGVTKATESPVSHPGAHARLLAQAHRTKQLKLSFPFVSHEPVRHEIGRAHV